MLFAITLRLLIPAFLLVFLSFWGVTRFLAWLLQSKYSKYLFLLVIIRILLLIVIITLIIIFIIELIILLRVDTQIVFKTEWDKFISEVSADFVIDLNFFIGLSFNSINTPAASSSSASASVVSSTETVLKKLKKLSA